jgi:hypothetical protein
MRAGPDIEFQHCGHADQVTVGCRQLAVRSWRSRGAAVGSAVQPDHGRAQGATKSFAAAWTCLDGLYIRSCGLLALWMLPIL